MIIYEGTLIPRIVEYDCNHFIDELDFQYTNSIISKVSKKEIKRYVKCLK
ncbi:MAG: hypothetical protein HFJ12_02340 [Bacilli bacterium]|nr:hypothetical protein [Bacilli bacterium]